MRTFVIGDSAIGKERITAEDRHEADYGLLLEQSAQKSVKRVASQSTPSWNQISDFLQKMDELRRLGLRAA